MTALAPARPGRRRWLWRQVVHGFAVVGVVLTVFHLGFHLSVVMSPSMSPTLQGGIDREQDWVLSERVTLWFRSPRRWEVVRLVTREGDQVIKRVVGLRGESVSIRDGKAQVNGSPLAVPSSLAFLHYYGYGPYGRGDWVPCSEGYFVLGDDSKDSDDSRYNGPVRASEIRYRAWLRVWPPSRFGFVNP